MTRKLVLHVGDCKTGSTAVQNMLARGAYRIPGQTVFYPQNLRHGQLARSLNAAPHLVKARWSRARDLLGAQDWDLAILSTELFEFTPPERLQDAVTTYLSDVVDEVTVLGYIRPHASRLTAHYCENVKLGLVDTDLDAFAEGFHRQGTLHYSKRLSKWAAVFGDQLHVRPYLRDHLHQGDICHDVLRTVLGHQNFTIDPAQGGRNETLSVEDVTMLRWIQRQLRQAGIDEMGRIRFGNQFAELSRQVSKVGSATRLQIHQDLMTRYSAGWLADAQTLDATWFGGTGFADAVDTAQAEALQTPVPLEAEAYHSAETLRQAEIWASLIVRRMSQAKKSQTTDAL